MSPYSSFILVSFSCLLLFASGGSANGENLSFSQVLVSSFLPSASCSASKGVSVAGSAGSSIRVLNLYGPCSGNPVSEQDHVAALAHDALRVASIQATVAGTSFENDSSILGSQISIPARSGLFIGSGNYVITVGFGTPTRTQTVVFDTGSDVNWLQCKPCAVRCYAQQEPLFDPSLSSTYRNVSCTEPACVGLSTRGCSSSTCLYGVFYGDGSSTIGFLAMDTFMLTPAQKFKNFIFGCGQNNTGLFQGTAGLVGLGRSSTYSLNSQVAPSLGNVFSYCLPSTSSATGYLNIGNPQNTPGYTAMLTDTRVPTLYFIDLIGISVGGTRLSLSSTVFQSVGTIIDSGTVITRLPPTAYSALKTAVRAAMTQYTLAPAVTILDTCYDFSRTTSVVYPVIVLHFAGLDVRIPATGVFFVFNSSQVCLAFAGNTDSTMIGIIGNVQQLTMEVTYDNELKRIGFSAGACP